LTREVEKQREPFANLDAVIAHEHAISRSIGGKTVFDDKATSRKAVARRQLNLF
jgi:hypothetical protein